MRLIELYSGIGGMHCALKRALPNVEVVCAVDINDVATSVYRHNFPETRCINRVIENLCEDEFRDYNADIWTLSPPCQPFTRLGNRKCEADNRTSSFNHLIGLIPRVLPEFLLLENVKGFEGSEPWRQLLNILKTNGYQYQQFLLSPLQFGVPNCRLRFYLVARRQSTSTQKELVECDPFEELERVHKTPPVEAPPLPNCNCPMCLNIVRNIKNPDNHFSEYYEFCRPVSEFLISDELVKDSSAIPDISVQRYFQLMDIVQPEYRKTRCFTKGYSKRLEGTGSILQTANLHLKTSDIHSVWLSIHDDKDAILLFARELGLRFFNSREVANLMSFPDNYSFPENVTEKQRLRLLGNSISVIVVAHIAYWAFGGHRCDIFME